MQSTVLTTCLTSSKIEALEHMIGFLTAKQVLNAPLHDSVESRYGRIKKSDSARLGSNSLNSRCSVEKKTSSLSDLSFIRNYIFQNMRQTVHPTN